VWEGPGDLLPIVGYTGRLRLKGGGLYREAPPGAFFNLAVYYRVGKIAILVYKRVTKSAAKWKKW